MQIKNKSALLMALLYALSLQAAILPLQAKEEPEETVEKPESVEEAQEPLERVLTTGDLNIQTGSVRENPEQTDPDAKFGFTQSEKGWQFIKEDGTLAKSEIIAFEGKLYAFDDDGLTVQGYIEISGNTYFGQKEERHPLLVNTSYDGHYFDENGMLCQEKWIRTEAGWQLYKEDGNLAKNGFYTAFNGQIYYFDASGIMKTGWIQENGHDYCLQNSGELIKNRFVQNKWYVNDQGIYQPESWQKFKEGWSLKKGDGTWAKNEYWASENGHTYWFDEQGFMQTGWSVLHGKSYYFVRSGEMAKNRWIDGKWFVGKDGAWIQNHWEKQENGRYAWVYGDGTRPAEGKLTLDGKEYYFDEQGLMVTGWKKLDAHWYFFGEDGEMLKRQMVDDNWYVNSTGIGYTGYDVEIAQYVDGIYDRVGMDLYKLFCWVPDHMRYQKLPIPLPIQGTRTELQNYARYAMALKGNCYCYAALFWYIADGLGYEPEFVQGNVPYRNGTIGPHGWVVMYENGTKYYYDPEGSYERGQYFFRKRKGETPWNYDR